MGLWKKIKEKLKRFYPVTLLRFNQRLEKTEERLERIQNSVNGAASALEGLQRERERDGVRDILYCSPGEVNDIDTRGFFEARNSPDYLYRYKKLVRGLDEKSIETVNLVLSRHQLVYGKKNETFDLWTQEEKQIILRQRQEFYANTLEIAEGVYACGKYLLASPESGMGHIETSVITDCCGFFELDHPERIKDRDILDLGAFIGDSALVLGEHTAGKVHAFEPSTENYKALLKTIELNEAEDKIVPVKAGAGAERGVASIQACFGMWMSLNTDGREQLRQDSFETIPVITVDDYVKEYGIQVGLIKVDVEGFEQQVLQGAEHTLRTQRPALLLSMYHNASDFFDLKPILEEMDLGYTFKVHKEINERIHYDTLLIAEAK